MKSNKEEENLILTEKYILKNCNVDEMKKEITKYVPKYGGYLEEIDFEKGCTVSPKKDDVDGYLYIATYVDNHHHERPDGYRFRFFDKKIGVSYDVVNRMEKLTNEIKVGRKNPLKKGYLTHTPIKAKAIKCWKLGLENTYRIEFYLHKLLYNRKTQGEWFNDYNEDLVSIVENEIIKFVNNGASVDVCIMDELLSENIHRFEKINPTIKVEEKEPEVLRYRL